MSSMAPARKSRMQRAALPKPAAVFRPPQVGPRQNMPRTVTVCGELSCAFAFRAFSVRCDMGPRKLAGLFSFVFLSERSGYFLGGVVIT